MATRKRVTSETGAYMSQYDQEIEKRLAALESQAHTPCGGGATSASIDAAGLPPLPPRKTSDLYDRVSALENRLEALIAKLSK